MPPDAPATPAAIEGTVSRVVWTSPDGRFAVVRVEVEGREAPVTVVGPLIGMGPADATQFAGHGPGKALSPQTARRSWSSTGCEPTDGTAPAGGVSGALRVEFGKSVAMDMVLSGRMIDGFV